ncbi:hypothetical protein Hanom_Chr04g00298501 [Helianthus anomalus]
MARPVAIVLAVLSQILRILEFTKPRVSIARPCVGCLVCPLLLFFLLQRIFPWARPMPGGHDPVSELLILLFCWFGCGCGFGELCQSSFIVFMLVAVILLILCV